MTFKALPFRLRGKGRIFTLCWILAAGASAAVSQAATYYRWVDDEGVPHYTSTPPQGVISEKVNMGSGRAPVSDTPSSATHDETDQGQPQPADQTTTAQTSANKAYCEKARQRLQTLQSGRRLRMSTEDGGFRYLNEEDIQREIAETQKNMDESC